MADRWSELERVAQAANPGPDARAGMGGFWEVWAVYYDAANPPTILELIDLARRYEAAEADLQDSVKEVERLDKIWRRSKCNPAAPCLQYGCGRCG